MNQRFKVFIFIIIGIVCQGSLKAQSYKTIHLKPTHALISVDSIYYGKQDSIVNLPDTLKYFIVRNIGGSITLMQDYYKSLIIDTLKPNKEDPNDFSSANDYFKPYANKVIRNISILQVGTFTGNVNDTTKSNKSGIDNSIENRHFTTQKRVIRKNIRFVVNSTLSPSLIAENERLLRGLPYLKDARIYVNVDSIYIDTVDIVIVTQDKFPIGVGGLYSSLNKFYIETYSKNFLGTGNTASIRAKYDTKGEPVLGFGGKYSLTNTAGSFLQTTFEFENTYQKELYRIDLSKPFSSNDMRFGGGIECYRLSTDKIWNTYWPDSITVNESRYSMNYYDAWTAQSFFLKPDNYNKFFNTSVRYRYENYLSHPEVSPDTNFLFHTNHLVLFSTSYNNSKYYKTSRLMGFGVTEDVPQGLRYSVSSGFQILPYYTRTYLGTNLSLSKYFNKVGYFAYQLGVGGFFHSAIIEDVKVGSQLSYFSEYLKLGRFGVRNFLSLSGISLYNPKYLMYDNFGDRIRSLNQSDIYGASNLVIRAEPYFYSPYQLWGFNLAFSLYADIGWISTDNFYEGRLKYYSASGVSLHIKNESFDIPTLSSNMNYFPVYGESKNKLIFEVEFVDRKLFNNTIQHKPVLYFAY